MFSREPPSSGGTSIRLGPVPWWLGPAFVVSLAILAMVLIVQPFAPYDAYVYFASGERLNAGHPLYALSPGDRPIWLKPPYWTVPTLSPPFVAVLWRPLAMLGEMGVLVGWLVTAIAFLGALAVVARREPLFTFAATAVLAVAVAWQLDLGNVNGFLALGLVLLWRWRDRPVLAGTCVAVLTAVKLTPAFLVVWLIASGRRHAAVVFVAASIVLLGVTALGAGPQAIADYIDVMIHTTTVGTSELSVAGMLRAGGVPAAVAAAAPWAIIAAGAIATLWLRHRPAIGFGIAIVVLVLGSPVVQGYWYALLIMMLVALPTRSSGAQSLPT
jgi:hypothetical protein